MRNRFSSLRFRLTILFVCIFGAVQAMLWLGTSLIVQRQLRSRVDEFLAQAAHTLADLLVARDLAEASITADEQIVNVIQSFVRQDLYVQLSRLPGEPLVQSRNLRGLQLPPPDEPPPATGFPLATTLPGSKARTITGENAALRIVSLILTSPNDATLTVQVARSMSSYERMIADLHRLLTITLIVSLVSGGTVAWFLAGRSLAPIGQIAKQARVLSVGDLSQRVSEPATHDEVAEMARIFNEMLDRLERELRNQRQFIANVSHELKTPLSVLLGEAQSHRGGIKDAAQAKEFVETVEEETRHMLRILECFLILRRTWAGQRLTIGEVVPMDEIVPMAVQRCKSLAATYNVGIVLRLDQESITSEPIVLGDSDLLRGIVENLLGNAIRHAPEGTSVVVSVQTQDGAVVVRVQDSSAGFQTEELDRVFDLFRQTLREQTGTVSGKSDVGLSMVKAVSELHGGNVVARNREDTTGAEFVVRLPLYQD